MFSQTYLSALLVVREVAVTREPSCAELLPGVRVLVGLVKDMECKTRVVTPSLPVRTLLGKKYQPAATGKALLFMMRAREIHYCKYPIICLSIMFRKVALSAPM